MARRADAERGIVSTPHVPKEDTIRERAIEGRVRQPVGTSIGVLHQAAQSADELGDHAGAKIRKALKILEGLSQEWLA